MHCKSSNDIIKYGLVDDPLWPEILVLVAPAVQSPAAAMVNDLVIALLKVESEMVASLAVLSLAVVSSGAGT
jgi:hypothetical protein